MKKKKSKKIYICQNCDFESAMWTGQCPECKEWNTLEENIYSAEIGSLFENKNPSIEENESPKKLEEISFKENSRILSGIREFDRVLGGGITQGSLILIGGEPGIGKSTLLTKVIGNLSNKQKDDSFFYISGEESIEQIGSRAKRLNIKAKNLFIYHETHWQKIKTHIHKIKPKFLVIDSIQTTISADLVSPPGTISQIRDVTYELMNTIKGFNITCFIIGHITKEGSIAGPKILEHMVDTVIYFEGDQFGHYRMLRSIKNRFGNTNEVGVFEMTGKGLNEVRNPSQYFLEEQLKKSYGRSLTCILEGTRPIIVETQALVTNNKFGNGRRTTQGVDSNRLSMLIAVIEKYLDLSISDQDFYINVVGGLKLRGREGDLSLIASILSSFKSKPIDSSVIFLGEVGLTGEVRSCSQIEVHLKEIQQLSYKKVITSKKASEEFYKKFDIEIIGIEKAKDLEDLL